MQKDEERNRDSGGKSRTTEDRRGAFILLVEDDAILCDLVLRNLEARGHTVESAADARSAMRQLYARHFDLVILDINLPDRTGWDILRLAQRDGLLCPHTTDEQTYTLPVIILSAVRVSPGRLAEFHPLAYLPKPFPMEALLRLAEEAAHRKNPASNEEPPVPPCPRAFPSLEEESHA